MLRHLRTAVFILGMAGIAGAEEAANDLVKLQGSWVLVRDNALPGVSVIRKDVVGNKETTRFIDASGKTLHVQTSEFRIERVGKLRLLHWTKGTVTEGPNKGATIPDGTAVFTFKDGKWISVIGLPEGSPFAVTTETWSRPPADDSCSP